MNRASWIVAGLLFGLTRAASGAEAIPDPNPDIQKQVAEVVDAFREAHTEDLSVPLQKLAKLQGNVRSPERFMMELFYFRETHADEKTYGIIAVIYRILNISNFESVRAMVPYVESKNPVLRPLAQGLVREALRAYECTTSRDFEEFLRRGTDGPSVPLTVTMMYAYPGITLNQLVHARMDATEPAEAAKLKWAGRIVEDAIWAQKEQIDALFQEILPKAQEQLKRLSNDERWWVRAYVARVMRDNKFRDEDVYARLRTDKHEGVREMFDPDPPPPKREFRPRPIPPNTTTVPIEPPVDGSRPPQRVTEEKAPRK